MSKCVRMYEFIMVTDDKEMTRETQEAVLPKEELTKMDFTGSIGLLSVLLLQTNSSKRYDSRKYSSLHKSKITKSGVYVTGIPLYW